MGRLVIGVATTLAAAAAIAFVVELPTSATVHGSHASGPLRGPDVGVCGVPAADSSGSLASMADSFVIKNTSNSTVTIRSLRPTTLVGLESARVTLIDGAAAEEIRDFTVGASVNLSPDTVSESTSIAPDGSTSLEPNSFATIITTMTLAHGAQAERASNFEVTTQMPSGNVEKQTIRVSVGLGVSSSACSSQ